MSTRDSSSSSHSRDTSHSRDSSITKPKAEKAAAQTYNYKDEQVTIVRPATAADMGFRENAGDQVLVHFEDGHEEVVVKSVVEGE